MARPKAFDPSDALDAALATFWQRGYEKTSLDDLIAATRVGRQSLYDTFGDKRALYLRSLDRYRETTQAALRDLFATGRPIRECVRAVLFGIVDEPKAKHERGCLLLSANLERDLADPDVAALVKRNQVEVEAIFASAFEDARRRGDLDQAKNPAALARFFVVTIQGMRATARARSDRQALGQVARVALAALD